MFKTIPVRYTKNKYKIFNGKQGLHNIPCKNHAALFLSKFKIIQYWQCKEYENLQNISFQNKTNFSFSL